MIGAPRADDPTSPPCPFDVLPLLTKALPRNVLYLDFATSAAAVAASKILHPAGPSIEDSLNQLGELELELRAVGTFDVAQSPDTPALWRGGATMLINPATHELLLKSPDDQPNGVRLAIATPTLASFLSAFGISTTCFELATAATGSEDHNRVDERMPALVG